MRHEITYFEKTNTYAIALKLTAAIFHIIVYSAISYFELSIVIYLAGMNLSLKRLIII